MFRSHRFDDLIARQLDLFELEHGHLVSDAIDRRRSLPGADDATEAFGDYQDAVDWAAEGLVEIEDSYAQSLDGKTEKAYRRAFRRAAKRRFPNVAGAFLWVQDVTEVDDDE